jgi:hypothetical protein
MLAYPVASPPCDNGIALIEHVLLCKTDTDKETNGVVMRETLSGGKPTTKPASTPRRSDALVIPGLRETKRLGKEKIIL